MGSVFTGRCKPIHGALRFRHPWLHHSRENTTHPPIPAESPEGRPQTLATINRVRIRFGVRPQVTKTQASDVGGVLQKYVRHGCRTKPPWTGLRRLLQNTTRSRGRKDYATQNPATQATWMPAVANDCRRFICLTGHKKSPVSMQLTGL